MRPKSLLIILSRSLSFSFLYLIIEKEHNKIRKDLDLGLYCIGTCHVLFLDCLSHDVDKYGHQKDRHRSDTVCYDLGIGKGSHGSTFWFQINQTAHERAFLGSGMSGCSVYTLGGAERSQKDPKQSSISRRHLYNKSRFI